MKYNHYQFRDKSQFGIRYYYCYGTDDFEDYMKFKNIKYRKLPEDNSEGRNIINEQDKEIERLNNIINEKDKEIEDYSNKWCELAKAKTKSDNIINELEKILIIEISEAGFHYEKIKEDTLQWIFNELQELKGDGSNENFK